MAKKSKKKPVSRKIQNRKATVAKKVAKKKKAAKERKAAKKRVGKKTGNDEKGESKPKYQFPRFNECPRCNAEDTVQVSTQGRIQYRQCTRAVCREPFKVVGTLIEKAGKK